MGAARDGGVVAFKHLGREYDFTSADVATRMRGIEPDRIDTYFVTVNGIDYPVKQVGEMCITGLRQKHSTVSRRFLVSAGFEIKTED